MSESKQEMSPWCSDEHGYCAYLELERHMFAWCLVQFGAESLENAQLIAQEFYEYEPAGEPYRGLVFHDEAWHWAMRRLFGHGYWTRRPDLVAPSDAYLHECEAFSAIPGA
jgi:hypothetical protein